MSSRSSALQGLSFGSRRRSPTPLARATVWALAAAVVGLQISYPLLHGADRDTITILIVASFAATCLLHAALRRGPGWALAFAAITVLFSLAVEAVGVHTGFPFGHYEYGDRLGPLLLGVPVLVPLAWLMMGYLSLVVARRLTDRRWQQVALGAWALVSWDLFLDPQLTDASQWRWLHPSPHLPGVGRVPLTNTAGWLLAGLVLMSVLSLLPARRADDTVPLVLWVWTWLSSALAFAAFFHEPWVALWGGLGMAVIGLPLLVSLSSRPSP